MSQKKPATISNVSQHARPLDAGPVLGPGQTLEVDDTGKGDAHYAELGDLVIREAGWEPTPEPSNDADDGDDEVSKPETTSRARGGKAGAQ